VALSNFPSIEINVALWSRTISLFLTGVLILSSLAQILRSVGKIVRLTSKTAGASFLLLGLGQLFASQNLKNLANDSLYMLFHY
jgi:Gpi18-like mannosyltransferase